MFFVWSALTISMTVSTTIPLHQDPLVYGAPFSHLFTELKISPIELKISTIQLKISSNRLNCRLFVDIFNWFVDIFNWIERYLQFIWRYLQFIWRYLQFIWRYLQLSRFEDIYNWIADMCTSIGDIFNSVNKCENCAPYRPAYVHPPLWDSCQSFYYNLYTHSSTASNRMHH